MTLCSTPHRSIARNPAHSAYRSTIRPHKPSRRSDSISQNHEPYHQAIPLHIYHRRYVSVGRCRLRYCCTSSLCTSHHPPRYIFRDLTASRFRQIDRCISHCCLPSVAPRAPWGDCRQSSKCTIRDFSRLFGLVHRLTLRWSLSF
jgi:hypothetical protein